MWEEKVSVKGPYHFDSALLRLARDPLHIINEEERSIKIPIYKEAPEIADIQAIGTVNEPLFLVRGKNKDTKHLIMERISTIFQWDLPLGDIHSHFSKTALKEVFEQHKGTPIVLEFDLYPALIRPIIHQQVNTSFAISLTDQFVRTFGYEIEGVPFFPDPKTVSGLRPDQLKDLRFSRRKAEYLIDLSKLLSKGELNLKNLAEKTDEEVIKELTAIRGIGPWTAQSFLLFGLGRKNLFPMADVGLQNALKKLHKLDRKPTVKDMEAYTKEWYPYLSYASLYLWRSIE
ncbi:DNA-3-methyladenine glycosylase family protein [Siminovitchia sediminis]|uniref:DNA-3-methyladenine glycosylase II n=1 Tax=Siminovitchia sediminis TaxID=1274353 RepID=A0ABW4KPW3_9BACI